MDIPFADYTLELGLALELESLVQFADIVHCTIKFHEIYSRTEIDLFQLQRRHTLMTQKAVKQLCSPTFTAVC